MFIDDKGPLLWFVDMGHKVIGNIVNDWSHL